MIVRNSFFVLALSLFTISPSLAKDNDNNEVGGTFVIKAGAAENGSQAMGAEAQVTKSNAGTGYLGLISSENGQRASFTWDSPGIALGGAASASTDLTALSDPSLTRNVFNSARAVAGSVFWQPTRVESQISLNKNNQDGSDVGDARSIVSTNLGIDLSGAEVNGWCEYAQAGRIALTGGIAGGVVKNKGNSNIAAVMGPRVGLTGNYILVGSSRHGIATNLDLGYVYNLGKNLNHVFGAKAGVDYVRVMGDGIQLRVGPEASYNLAKVKSAEGTPSGSGKDYFVGLHAGLAL